MMDVTMVFENGVQNIHLLREVTTVQRSVDVEPAQEAEQRVNVIPAPAISFWGKLLKTDSVEETLRFILYVRDNPVDNPFLDEQDGLTVWAPAYEQLLYDEGKIDELTLGGFNRTRELLGLPVKDESGISTMSAQQDNSAYLENTAWECYTKLASVDGLLDKINEDADTMVASFVDRKDEETSQDG